MSKYLWQKEDLQVEDTPPFEKALDFGPQQPRGAKAVGSNIEQRLYNSLNRDVNSYLASVHGGQSKAQVFRGLRQAIDRWATVQIPTAEKEFHRLFQLGFLAGAREAGFSGKMGTEDTNALKVLEQGIYNIGENIRTFGDDVVEQFAKILQQAFTKEGTFALEDMVKRMREVVPAERYALERIARTEVVATSNAGKLWAWNQDPEKYRYGYSWNSTPDSRRREMKKIRSDGNPYDWDGIKFLFLHNKQRLPNGKFQNGNIQCRCSLSRYPLGAEFRQPDRFKGQEQNYQKTLDLPL